MFRKVWFVVALTLFAMPAYAEEWDSLTIRAGCIGAAVGDGCIGVPTQRHGRPYRYEDHDRDHDRDHRYDHHHHYDNENDGDW